MCWFCGTSALSLVLFQIREWRLAGLCLKHRQVSWLACCAPRPPVWNWAGEVVHSEVRSCVEMKVVVLGSPSLTVRTVSVNVKQHWTWSWRLPRNKVNETVASNLCTSCDTWRCSVHTIPLIVTHKTRFLNLMSFNVTSKQQQDQQNKTNKTPDFHFLFRFLLAIQQLKHAFRGLVPLTTIVPLY